MLNKRQNETAHVRTGFSSIILRERIAYGRKLRPLFIHRPVQLLLDGFCGALAVMLAYGLRFDMAIPHWARTQMWCWAAILFVLDPLVIFVFQGYRSTWQYFGLRDLRLLATRLACLNALLLLVPAFTPAQHLNLIPYSIIIMDWMFMLFFSSTVRVLRRLDHEALLRLSAHHRILVVGTADTIASAIHQLQPLYGKCLCGVVIESGKLSNRSIHGVPVLGAYDSVARLIYSHNINLLFLCSADLEDLPGLMQTAASFDIPVRFLPTVHDLLDNRVRVSKPVSVEAIDKGRKLALTLDDNVIECLRGKTVLVTGAGGSIGSELVRQVSRAPVRKLVLLDQDENAVFELLGELKTTVDLQPVIADIRDGNALRQLFARERPEIVLHAAAYKHVPMMEANPCEAVLNNVHGTRTLAETAVAFDAERLVMISSDKAVRPSSVMGATKRTAEVVIQEIARSLAGAVGAKTQFACVRFGNVLGSRGSVLPIFLKQIEQGGPVTVTHAEMTRYFMTIPQAVHLVLQAATLGSQGDIYMLDMGDPVLIMDFAREIIQLSGLTLNENIEIRIVGSRPGEKLHEQLWREDAEVSPTTFKHIYRVLAEPSDPAFPATLVELETAAREHRAEDIRPLLQRMPIDYLTERAALTENTAA